MPVQMSSRRRTAVAAGLFLVVTGAGWDQIKLIPVKFRQVSMLMRGGQGHGHSHGPGRGHHTHAGASHSHGGAAHDHAGDEVIDLPQEARRVRGITFATVSREEGVGEEAELLIPRAAVVRHGEKEVFFRRDPEDPARVLRTEADLGPDHGELVTVYSGVKEGDEVVSGGVETLLHPR